MLLFALLFAAGAAATTTEIAPGVWLLPGSFVEGTQPDGNSLMFRAPKGLVVIDTGRHAEHTQGIIDFAANAHEPVAAIINTHWHLDHVGGNAQLRREFPAVHVYATAAIQQALTGFLASYRAQLTEMINKTPDAEAQRPWRQEIALIDAGQALAPTDVLAKSEKRSIAGHKFALHVEHGATAGDIWVFDPSSGVLASGDLVTLPVPFLDTACPSRWREALDRVAKEDFRVLIPGHGRPMRRVQFETYRTAFANLLGCASSSRSRDECASAWLTDVHAQIAAERPAFVRSMLNYYIDTQLRGDPAMLAKRCAN